jgi:hypothetical protein
MIMSPKDPIIEKIHAVREEIARQAGYDLEKILEGHKRGKQPVIGRP